MQVLSQHVFSYRLFPIMKLFSTYTHLIRRAWLLAGALGVSAALVACGGGNDSNTPLITVSVSGTISGLAAGQSVTFLETNSGRTATFSTNGTQTLIASVPQGATYSLRVSAQPSGQTCSITNANGTVAAASITNVAVTCANNTVSVSGTITGLTMDRSFTILESNSGQTASFSTNGLQTLFAAVPRGATLSLSISAQSEGHACTIEQMASSMTVDGNIIGVVVECTSEVEFILTVTGLPPSQQVTVEGPGGLSYSGGNIQSFSLGSLPLGTVYSFTPSPNDYSILCSESLTGTAQGTVINLQVVCTDLG
jgi:hypothetical protein